MILEKVAQHDSLQLLGTVGQGGKLMKQLLSRKLLDDLDIVMIDYAPPSISSAIYGGGGGGIFCINIISIL
jgi:hypothetical protein